MAAHSNRSPSPIGPSRPINPSLRNPENISGIRRSFSTKPSILTNSRRFEPTTPANSPSDFPRRHSVDSYPKEKENSEKDQNMRGLKCQPSAKGSKNFMTPTISASSKFSPSPKKKVLVERTDPVRTSMSLSDGKALFYSTNMSEELESKPEICHHKSRRTEGSQDYIEVNLEKKQAVPEDLRASKSSKRVTFDVPTDSHSESLLDSVITEPGSSCLNSEISCSSTLSTIAPLDADPSLPPYDPKTNYLSPRPQFLHYKPNPRIEILLNKEKGRLEGEELKQLEDSLMAEILSESFSDSERSEDSLNGDPQREELGDMVSDDIVVGIYEEIEDMPTGASEFSESLQSSTCSSDAVSEVSSVEEKQKKPSSVSEVNSVEEKQNKTWSVSRWLCFSIIPMFLFACGSVFVFESPAFNEIALKELRISEVSKMYQSGLASSARMNFDRFARQVNQLSVNSASFISNLANELGGRENDIASPQFVNLSNLRSGEQNPGDFLLKKESNEEQLMEDLEENDEELKGNVNVEMGIDSDDKEFEAQEVILEGFDEGDDVKLEEIVDDEIVHEEETTYFEGEDGADYEEIHEDEETAYFEGDVGFEEVVDYEIIREDETTYFEVDSNDNLLKKYGTGDDAFDAENTGLDRLKLVVAGTDPENSEFMEGQEIVDDDEMEGLGMVSHEEEVASDRAETEAEAGTMTALETGSQSIEDKKFPGAHYAAGLSTLIAFLFAAAAYTYHLKRFFRGEAANIVQENSSKQGDMQTVRDMKTFSQNWRQTEVAETETCPSEMSSFRHNTTATSSYSKKEMMREGSEAQSTERRKTATRRHYSKREQQQQQQQPPLMTATSSSTAISSSEYTTDSPSSYGSFTTFERIPIKKVNGEDEVITPVRRSSRLRNHHHHQVVSP